MEQDKSYIESMIASQQRVRLLVGEPVRRLRSREPSRPSLQSLLTEESDLTRRYTDDYPDVVAVRRKIKNLRAQMAEAPAAAPPRLHRQLDAESQRLAGRAAAARSASLARSGNPVEAA